jgi:hypothetical protein
VTGVSIRLTVASAIANDTTPALMVIPRWRSRASESVCVVPASTLPISSMTPGGVEQPLGERLSSRVYMRQDSQVERSLRQSLIPSEVETLRDGHECSTHRGSPRLAVGCCQRTIIRRACIAPGLIGLASIEGRRPPRR